MEDDVLDAIHRIRTWGEARDWSGYDPYDALNTPAVGVLTLGTPLGRRLLTQAVKRSPVNLRPLLRIRPAENAKALGLVVSAYARLAAAGDPTAREPALATVERLRSAAPAWGYHFEVQTRFFRYAAETPNTIATTFVAQGMLDAYELLGHEPSGEAAYGAARYLVATMLTRDARGPYFKYLEREDELVHNANLLACAAVARAARRLGDPQLAEPVGPALASTLAAQRDDGSWPYAAGHGRDWVDNFHTGYVLESLAECASLVPGGDDALQRGFDYWERELFLDDGTPKYYDSRVRPLDAHNYAQAIETWLSVSDRRDTAVAHAERTAHLLIRDFLASAGHVVFQKGRWFANSTPFVRWTTAPSFRALARLALARAGGPEAVAAGRS